LIFFEEVLPDGELADFRVELAALRLEIPVATGSCGSGTEGSGGTL
jgi:hypothetical protein